MAYEWKTCIHTEKIKGNLVSMQDLEEHYAIPSAYKAYKEGLIEWMKHM